MIPAESRATDFTTLLTKSLKQNARNSCTWHVRIAHTAFYMNLTTSFSPVARAAWYRLLMPQTQETSSPRTVIAMMSLNIQNVSSLNPIAIAALEIVSQHSIIHHRVLSFWRLKAIHARGWHSRLLLCGRHITI